jgi:hypothetical protein
MDVRSESPEDTAVRLFGALRLMRYKMPVDEEELFVPQFIHVKQRIQFAEVHFMQALLKVIRQSFMAYCTGWSHIWTSCNSAHTWHDFLYLLMCHLILPMILTLNERDLSAPCSCNSLRCVCVGDGINETVHCCFRKYIKRRVPIVMILPQWMMCDRICN